VSQSPDRRNFLKLAAKSLSAAGALAVVPESIQKALAIPADVRSGTINDVEHIVILMQENRSFDHYFGTMQGVRGFGDRNTIPLPHHRTVWQQPDRHTGSEILPFHLDSTKTRAQCVRSLDHGWATGHKAWNHGKYNDWIEQKTRLTMGHYKESDIPFQFALANAFTICDAYFCSIMSATDPNRVYHWTGTINPPGFKGGPLIHNDQIEENVANWTTCPERLEKAGISWRIYQKSLEYDDKRPFDGNYGDNPLAYFLQYIQAPVDSKLHLDAMSPHPLEEFALDVKHNRLPQVSWVVAPEAYSEHPAWPPAYGAQYTSQVLDALTANPEVWSKTVLFINYDENDGFFDHVVPPTPPVSPQHGQSTVDASDELYDDPQLGIMPLGLGIRVPMTIVSPWTRGGWVCSQVFDHTSVLRFLEVRFGEAMHETNISRWRRSVCGNLTSAFDFAQRDTSRPRLPDTSSYKEHTDEACQRLREPDAPPRGHLPKQQRGTKPARALPYQLQAHGRLDPERRGLWVDFTNLGQAGTVFHAYSSPFETPPRVFTVEANKELSAFWSFEQDLEPLYSLHILGPNGFRREFSGDAGQVDFEPTVLAHAESNKLRLTLAFSNPSPSDQVFSIRDNAYGKDPLRISLPPFAHKQISFDLAASHCWYDLSVQDYETNFVRRFAGHLENGLPSVTDPA
jgi:phospholipase C